jgi:hypothetical protein
VYCRFYLSVYGFVLYMRTVLFIYLCRVLIGSFEVNMLKIKNLIELCRHSSHLMHEPSEYESGKLWHTYPDMRSRMLQEANIF